MKRSPRKNLLIREMRRKRKVDTSASRLIREVAAATAHSAPNRNVLRFFESFAERVSANLKINQPGSAKRAQDRYKRQQNAFEKSKRRDEIRSWVGGEVGEMIELLRTMKEARDDAELRKGLQKKADQEL